MIKLRRRKSKDSEQISLNDIHLKMGDIIYKDGTPYATVSSVSDNLYLLIRKTEHGDITTPYRKETLIDLILSGILTVDSLRY